MNDEARSLLLRAGALLSGVVIAVCVMVLTANYVVARIQTPKDDALILDLQEQLEADSSIAPVLEAEHARITSARANRKAATESLSILLMVAGSLFIACMKWIVGEKPRLPVALVQIEDHAPSTADSRRSAPKAPGAAPALDLAFVDEIVATTGTGKEAAIPILQAIQTHYRYLPDEALVRVCELTEITPAQIAGTSSFYAQFRRSPVGKHIVRVCHGTACHVAGARQITEELRRHLDIPDGEDTDSDRMFTIDEVACVGCCSLAPVLMVDGHTAGKLTPSSACAALDAVEQKELA